MTPHAIGIPTNVEARLDKVFDFSAIHVVNPNHFLHKKLSMRMTGIRRITIAGNVIKIIGTPASANRGRKANGYLIRRILSDAEVSRWAAQRRFIGVITIICRVLLVLGGPISYNGMKSSQPAILWAE
jgi:hypothetical protein